MKKNILIVGGSSGVGLALVKLLCQENNVIIATRVGLGKSCILKQDTAINQDLRAIIPKDGSKIKILYLFSVTQHLFLILIFFQKH